MEETAIYLIKSSLWLTGFAIVYMLFLRRERYFNLKRVYLISGILVSFLFPLITIHYAVEIPAPTPVSALLTNLQEQVYTTPVPVDVERNEFNPVNLFLALYFAGILAVFYLNLLQYLKLRRTIRRSNVIVYGTVKLVRTNDYTSSFSFFNYIFVHPDISEDEVKEILNHEAVHVNQKHCFDLILGELLRMLQWANPFSWVYTGYIRLNHEYLADSVALQLSADPTFYKATLLNQMFRSPVIRLSNSFNYSNTKERFDMMTKKITSPYRKIKVLLIIPVAACIFYAFAEPVTRYTAADDPGKTALTIYESDPVFYVPVKPAVISVTQQGIRGTVKDENGKPVAGALLVPIINGQSSYPTATSDKDGNFSFSSVPAGSTLRITAVGYKASTIQPVFGKQMEISLVKDPSMSVPQVIRKEPLVVIDGEVTDKKYSEIRKELGHNYGLMKMVQGEQATSKYGERGANGVAEITTRKKAIEMGMNPPYPRIGPEDYPTFQGESHFTFTKWVLDRVTYPKEATEKGIEGWVTVNYYIEKGGSVKIAESGTFGPRELIDEVARVIMSGPGFEPPKNPEADEQLMSGVTLRFRLPDQVLRESPPFVVVEEMPLYPGGDVALLEFLKNNITYPEEQKNQKIGGRVIVRFIVTSEGTAEGISVLKGVHPALDAEAIKVVQKLKGFKPGFQGGKPVNTWYMVPITFTPPVN